MADNRTFLDKYMDRMKADATKAPAQDDLTDPMVRLSREMLRGAEGELPMAPTANQEEPASKAPVAPQAPVAEAPPVEASEAATEEKKEVANARVVEVLPDEKLEDVISELHELTGLEDIKEHIDTLVNLLRVQAQRKAHDLPTVEIGLHRLFIGNPGTGKTTVARFMGRLYKAAGRLSKGHLVETDRSGLVGGFVGQTALKTKEVLEAAKGGVLFLDEAYALVPDDGGNDFGQEAITTILKFMEDNREDFVFIGAGYPREMKRFIDSNSGFASRFNELMDFPDYDSLELGEIFDSMVKKNHYTLTKEGKEKVKADLQWFTENKNANFANGRLVRKYFEELIQNQANRLGRSKKDLTKNQLKRIGISDFPKDLTKLL